MNHSRHGSLRARAHVCRCTRNRAGGGQPAYQRRKNIRDALRHQLHVGIVLIVAHFVRDHRGHERLDCAEHCYRQRRRK